MIHATHSHTKKNDLIPKTHTTHNSISMRFPTLAIALVLATPSIVDAFSVQPAAALTRCSTSSSSTSRIWAEESKDAVFMPPAADEGDDEEDDDLLDKAELLGRGAAKVRRPHWLRTIISKQTKKYSNSSSLSFFNNFLLGKTRKTKRNFRGNE